MRTSILLVLALAACGGGDDGPPAPPDPPGDGDPDAAAESGPDAFPSVCGQPGDVGNELGVGQFCETLTDCSDTADAPLCSSFGDPTTHFCTRLCDEGSGSEQCGTGAECACGDGGCGCTPTECLS
jgi:hypothetical protein